MLVWLIVHHCRIHVRGRVSGNRRSRRRTASARDGQELAAVAFTKRTLVDSGWRGATGNRRQPVRVRLGGEGLSLSSLSAASSPPNAEIQSSTALIRSAMLSERFQPASKCQTTSRIK